MKQLILPFLLLFLLVEVASAQRSDAVKNYDDLAYAKAIDQLERVVRQNPRDFKAHEMLAVSYRLNNDLKKAEQAYKWIYDTGLANADHYFHYAHLLMENGKNEEARKVLQKFSNHSPKDIRWKNLLKGLDEKTKNEEEMFTVSKCSLNSGDADFAPVIFNEGIAFVSNRLLMTLMDKQDAWTGKEYFRLYYAKGEKAIFDNAHAMQSELEQVRNDGPFCFNRDQNVMYWTANDMSPRREGEKSKVRKLRIYISDWKEGRWEYRSEFAWNSEKYSCAHPALSLDGTTIYFSSDMPGGRGGMDIWKSIYKDGFWSEPINLGPEINTAGNEVFPALTISGELYFASNGLPGFGGLDIYMCLPNEYGDFNTPVNMGEPINSKGDDFGITWSPNKDFGYFSSNRKTEGPDDDIYYFTRTVVEKKQEEKKEDALALKSDDKQDATKNDSFTVKGRIFNSDDNSPLRNHPMLLTCQQTGESISLYTDSLGNYTKGGLQPNMDFELTALKIDCGDVRKAFNTFFTNEKNEVVVDIPVYCVDDVIVLHNIYYDYDKWDIRDDAALELNKLAELMRQYPSMRIELSSHTDARGDDLYNYVLSRNRANSAAAYLISLGIESSRIEAKGYGESRLLNRCGNEAECTEMEHEENRRTEFKILYIESNNGLNSSGMIRSH